MLKMRRKNSRPLPNINLWANVISRVEFRWDHVEHGNFFGASSTTGAAFRANDFLLALNLIYQF